MLVFLFVFFGFVFIRGVRGVGLVRRELLGGSYFI